VTQIVLVGDSRSIRREIYRDFIMPRAALPLGSFFEIVGKSRAQFVAKG
jgi:hypothetical protein